MDNNTLDLTEDKKVFGKLETIVKQTLNKNLHNSEISSEGINTGFTDLDKLIKGFKNGELTTIAVRPGIGKTSFLLSMINNIGICDNIPLSLFSLERSADKIVQRMIESSTGLSIPKINKGDVSESERVHIKNIANGISKSAINIVDKKTIFLNELKEMAKEMVDNGIKIIFIDYLELMATNIIDENCNNNELCTIMNELNKMAKELNIPVVVFSQLSKPKIYNNKYKYTPDHINNNTDSLLFVNRPDFYHINDIDQKQKGIAEITVVKNNSLQNPEAVKLRFIESLDRFDNLN